MFAAVYLPLQSLAASNLISPLPRDESGQLLFQALRYAPRDFKQRRPVGKGGWTWNLKGVRRVLNRLPELLAADPGATVFVSEGEKDVDRLVREGLLATTNPQGAGKWRAEFAEFLRGREVVILPDNDQPGRAHAEAVARSLQGVAASVKALELPNLPDKGDVSDWLDAGGDAQALGAMAAALPEWTAPAVTGAVAKQGQAKAPKTNPQARVGDITFTNTEQGNLPGVWATDADGNTT